MPFASFNSTNPRTNPVDFHKKKHVINTRPTYVQTKKYTYCPLISFWLERAPAAFLPILKKPLIFLLLFEHRGMDQPFPIPTNCPTTFACRTTIHISENNVIKYPNTQFYINRICAQLCYVYLWDLELHVHKSCFKANESIKLDIVTNFGTRNYLLLHIDFKSSYGTVR